VALDTHEGANTSAQMAAITVLLGCGIGITLMILAKPSSDFVFTLI
jgi:hypothetical protein